MRDTVPISALFNKVCPSLKRIYQGTREKFVCLLICCAIAQGAFADTITYQQLQRDQGGRTLTTAQAPTVARTDQNHQGQNQAPSMTAQGSRAVESANHPEFVRLPDGRIVRYGPGVICDENCVDAVSPAAFRGEGPSKWWLAPPIAAGVILCIALCGGNSGNPQTAPTIIIPTPTQPGTTQPSPSPGVSPGQPPSEIPEPGTIVLVGLGIGVLLSRRRMAAKNGN
jgi:hypothetical protein